MCCKLGRAINSKMNIKKLSINVKQQLNIVINHEELRIGQLYSLFQEICMQYRQSKAFQFAFDGFFPPGTMQLLTEKQVNESDEFTYLLYIISRLICELAKKTGKTEREQKRFIETRNFLVAHIKLNFTGKQIIEIGGLLPESIIRITGTKQYDSYVNKKYSEIFHKDYEEIARGMINLHAHNFEDIEINTQMSGEEKIVYSSNTIEHVQDIRKLIETIESLGTHTVAYFVFGPIRSHGMYGHHSSYTIAETKMLSREDLYGFHLLSQEDQYRVIKNNYREVGEDIEDIDALNIIASNLVSSKQLLNNKLVEDFYREFNISKLNIGSIKTYADLSDQPKQKIIDIYKSNKQLGDINTRNIGVVMFKDFAYYSANYSHLMQQIDPRETHWLQVFG